MIRTLSIVAAAAALVTLPAALPAAAQSVRISTLGKSPAQLHTEIRAAAQKLCTAELTPGITFPREELGRCVKSTVADTVARSQDPALAAIAQLKLAQR